MPWYLIGAAFVSTSVSSEQIVGTVGAAYKGGLGIANWEWWVLPTYLLMMIFFIPMYLRNKIMTVPELLNRRFGPACGNIYSFVILIGYVFVFLPPVIYGGSITLSELTGWKLEYVMAGIVLVTASYTLAGGLSAVMWTDAIQCVLLIGGGVIFYFVALDKIPGGWDAMVAAVPERFHLQATRFLLKIDRLNARIFYAGQFKRLQPYYLHNKTYTTNPTLLPYNSHFNVF